MLEDLCEVTLSINFAKSEDSDTSDLHSSPGPLAKNAERYKCFRCHGKQLRNCTECSNTGSLTASHPMAQLLQAILTRKLRGRREEGLQVEIIKEEEEDLEQKRMLCSFCELQCEVSLYSCIRCPWFHVCPRCESRHCQHAHKVTRNISSLCGKSVDLSIKLCFSCGSRIENCYSLCRTCEKQGNNYWVCDSCSDKNNFLHDVSHNIEPVIDYDSFKDNHMETVSQEFQEEEEFNQSIEINSDKPEEEDREEEVHIESHHHLRLDKKNSSIAQYVIEQDDPPLLGSIQQKKEEMVSRVRFQIEDGLFGSCDICTESKMPSRNILKPPTVFKYEERFSCTISQSSRHSNYREKQNQIDQPIDYLFSGYRCDICECQPIKNVKYHCQKCEDFDVCSKCYENISTTHPHSEQHFERIDGKDIREKALQKLMICQQTILQTSLNLTNRKSSRSKTLRLNSGYS